MKDKINKKMLIAEVVEKYPEAAAILVEDYGFHCIGCYAAGMETLEEGAMVHGMDKKDIKIMIENLNEMVSEAGNKPGNKDTA